MLPTIFAAHAGSFLLAITLKSLVVFGAAGLLCLALRRASAASRHALWLLTLVSLLCLPVFGVLLPSWSVPILYSAKLAAPKVSVQHPVIHVEPHLRPRVHHFLPKRPPMGNDDPTPSGTITGAMPIGALPNQMPITSPRPVSKVWTAASWVCLVWLAGALVVLAQTVIALISARRLIRHCHSVKMGPLAEAADSARQTLGLTRPLSVLEGAEDGLVVVPMTLGLFRPLVLLPRGAADWPSDRLRSVLLHEAAHAKRLDWPTMILARVACIVYWYHPLVWLAAARLREESEAACDDLVLGSGVPAPDYAAHLLEIVQMLAARPHPSAAMVAMAHRREVHDRLRTILAENRNRTALHRRSLVTATLITLTLAVIVAVMHPVALAAPQAGPRPRLQGQSARRPLRYVHAFVEGSQRSPDGKYLAVIPEGSPSVMKALRKREYHAAILESERDPGGDLIVYQVTPGSSHHLRKVATMHDPDEREAALWVPNQAHTLVFTTRRIPEKTIGDLALWSGGTRISRIVRARIFEEHFKVDSISSDGKSLIYDDMTPSGGLDFDRKCHVDITPWLIPHSMIPISAPSVQPGAILPAFHTADAGGHWSPDRKYLAISNLGVTVARMLNVYQVDPDFRHIRKVAVLTNIADSDSAIWLPNQAHSLVFASDRIFGNATLALWQGGTRIYRLVPKHSDYDGFEVDGLKADHKTLIYRHLTFQDRDWDHTSERTLDLSPWLAVGTAISATAHDTSQNKAEVLATIIANQQNADDTIRQARGALAAHIKAVQTLYTDVSEHPLAKPVKIVRINDWAVSGSKYYLHRHNPAIHGMAAADEVNIYDGHKTYDIIRQGPQAHYGLVYSGNDLDGITLWTVNPLLVGYEVDQRGGEKIADLLTQATHVTIHQGTDANFGPVYLVDCQFKSHNPVRFTFAQDWNDMAVRTEIDEPLSIAPGAYRRIIYQASFQDNIFSHPVCVATSAVVTSEMIVNSHTTREFAETCDFSDMDWDTVADSKFRPHFAPGTIMNDPKARKTYRIDAGGNWKQIASRYPS